MNGGTPTLASKSCALTLALITLASLESVANAEGQPNESLAGNWVLTEEKMRDVVEPDGRRAGGPGPTGLVIEVMDGEVTVRSDTGMNRALQTFELKPGGVEHEIPGPLNWDTTATSDWDDGKLVVDITRTIELPTGPYDIEMQDVYSVTDDVLTVERSQRAQTWISVFERVLPE